MREVRPVPRHHLVGLLAVVFGSLLRHLDVGVQLLLLLPRGLLAIRKSEHVNFPPLALFRNGLCALLEQVNGPALAL